ncbi:MAG TPA: hypothetical protein VII45_01680 [Solirubrobacterales bacterium]
MADAIQVTPATIRNWVRREASPRRGAVRIVDDLRRVVVILADAEVDGPDVAQWLRSRQGGNLNNDRPLDVIHDDPVRVLAAAHGFAMNEEERQAGETSLRVVPD